MKTWRERITEARERGKFTDEDIVAIGDFPTCMIGEASAVLGARAWDRHPTLHYMGLNGMWPKSEGPIWCVNTNLFDLAEARLDAIEDEVLRLKREATS